MIDQIAIVPERSEIDKKLRELIAAVNMGGSGSAVANIAPTYADLDAIDVPDGSLAFARNPTDPQSISFTPQAVVDYMAENEIDPSEMLDPGQLPNFPGRPANIDPPVTLRLSQSPVYQDVPLGQQSMIFAREGMQLIQIETRSDFFASAREYTFAFGVLDAITEQSGRQLVYSWDDVMWMKAVDGPIGGSSTTYVPAAPSDLVFVTDLMLLMNDGDVPDFWADVLLEGESAPSGLYIRVDGVWEPVGANSDGGDVSAFLGGAF